jgi:hypothetical protein
MTERVRTGSAVASRWQCSGRVLGVELSTAHTGLVVLSESGVFLHASTLDYQLTRQHKGDQPVTEAQRIERMLGIANDVVGITKDWKIRYVGIRGHAMNAAAYQVGEVSGVLKTQLYLALRIVSEVVPSIPAHKHVLGQGRPAGHEVVRAVRDGLGYDAKTPTEAEAAIVARYLFDKKVAEQKEVAR